MAFSSITCFACSEMDFGFGRKERLRLPFEFKSLQRVQHFFSLKLDSGFTSSRFLFVCFFLRWTSVHEPFLNLSVVSWVPEHLLSRMTNKGKVLISCKSVAWEREKEKKRDGGVSDISNCLYSQAISICLDFQNQTKQNKERKPQNNNKQTKIQKRKETAVVGIQLGKKKYHRYK